MRIACILTVFPTVAETFVYGDLRALKEAGHEIGLMHLLDGRRDVWQEDARMLAGDVVRGGPLISPSVLRDCLLFLLRRPLALPRTLLWIARGSATSRRGFFKTLAILPKCVQFAADCRRWRAEHVHATWANHAAVAALVIRRLTGLPFSISAHAGQDVFRDPVMLDAKVREASFVAVCNRAAHERLLEIGGEAAAGKLHHLSHGVDLRRFGTASPGRPPSVPRVVFVGRLDYGKGLSYLIDAAERLRSRGEAFRLDILGDGPETGRWRSEVSARGLDDRVRFHGAVAQQVVAEFLARGDLLVLSSEVRHDGGREGLPNVILEAMACGVPVVATRVSAVEEAVEDGVTGLVVPQRDPEALAAAMGRLLKDGELARRLGRAGRRRVEERFDREVCGRRFASLFSRRP